MNRSNCFKLVFFITLLSMPSLTFAAGAAMLMGLFYMALGFLVTLISVISALLSAVYAYYKNKAYSLGNTEKGNRYKKIQKNLEHIAVVIASIVAIIVVAYFVIIYCSNFIQFFSLKYYLNFLFTK
jgi:NADH:ubiquinone oxidoreductase subunit 4 (subunit M)